MNYRVILVPWAQRDLDRIVSWVARKSTTGAAKILAQFHRALAMLGESPFGYGMAPEAVLLRREIRQILFKTRRGLTYRALFDVKDDCVRVLRIRGPGQDLVDVDELD